VTSISSTELARKPAVAGIARAGVSRAGAVPSIHDVDGVGAIANIILRYEEEPMSTVATPAWTEEEA
jgi:hypothetical protein